MSKAKDLKGRGKPMKDVELRLVSELMKNSRRSDRELAKAIGVSQPTVSRTVKRLEKEGYIQEYTMIPNFAKLGYKILALTFVKLKQPLNEQEIDRARKIAKDAIKTGPFEVVMLEKGIGLDSDGVFISYHLDYDAHVKFMDWLRQFEFLKIDEIRSFLVNLEDEVRYRPLTFSLLSQHKLRTELGKE
jgi:DNA-binding Lrp family transcriptional regulator